MNYKLESELKLKFPQLLDDLEYLEVGDGWSNIVENMCFLIQNDYNIKSRENPLVKQPKLIQIKQKFGGLRAYLENSQQSEYVNAVIDMAERMSYCTCEFCANAVNTANDYTHLNGWRIILCKECRKEKEKHF
jgi:hypothetical protein